MRIGNATAEIIVPTMAANATNAQMIAPAIKESMMSLNAAFLAFPECFMWVKGKVYRLRVKVKVLEGVYAQFPLQRSSARIKRMDSMSQFAFNRAMTLWRQHLAAVNLANIKAID